MINLLNMRIQAQSKGGTISDMKDFASKLDVSENTQDTDLVLKIVAVINYLIGIVGLIAIVFIVYGAVLIVTAGGDESKVEKGRNTIVQSLIGLVLSILTGVIFRFITARVGSV